MQGKREREPQRMGAPAFQSTQTTASPPACDPPWLPLSTWSNHPGKEVRGWCVEMCKVYGGGDECGVLVMN